MKQAVASKKRISVALLLGGILLAGCTDGFSLENLRNRIDPVPQAPSASASISARPKPDSRGVVTYPNYQIIVARRGDTLADVAGRVGMDPTVLAKYNGLNVNYLPRGGEVLALPRGVIKPQAAPTGASDRDLERIASAALEESGTQTGFIQTGPEPIQHVVEKNETAYTVARLYGVSVTSLPSWNGLDGDLSVREGQRLMIPVSVDGTPKDQLAEVEEPPEPGTGTPTPQPPSASTPLPETVAAATLPESPDLAETRTPTGASRKLLKPISGIILRGYDKAAGNEGVDIKAPSGTVVKAAEDGEVALISKANAGNTILLLRHADNLYTVYSNVGDVSVIKGQSIRRGQSVAKIAQDATYLHFEIRRGTESVDPLPYF